jgi:hypothetical protein
MIGQKRKAAYRDASKKRERAAFPEAGFSVREK